MSRHLKNYVATRAATRLVMDAAQSEKAKAGRVTMPKVFFVIGIIGFVLLATATFLCGRIPHMIGIAAGFAILALPDLALIIAYFNQRIYYTDEMFVHKSFTDFLIIFANLRKCWKGLLYQAFPAFCVSEDTPHIMAFRSLTWR